MTRFICCVGFILTVSLAFSQKVYFVYLESESRQPFFAKIGDKTFNSSASGYLILSNLRDSSYMITIGFPGNKWPDQQFTLPIRSKDRGFVLKNFGEKGWGLYDLQTLSIQMSEASQKEKAGTIKHGGVSAFTALLSKAANDPSLLESPVFAKKENKPVIAEQAVKKDVANTQKEQPGANAIGTAQTKKEVPDSKNGQPASNTVAGTQTKEEPTDSQKAEPAANTVATTQTKKEVTDSQKGEPATNTVGTSQTKGEIADSQKVQPATNTFASIQTKKEVPDSQRTQPASNVPATDPAKKNAADSQKAASAIAIDQTKKADTSAALTKLPGENTTTPKIGEQQKKPETGVAVTADKQDKSTGAMAVSGEKQDQANLPATNTKTDVAAKKPASPEKYKRSLVTKRSESSTTDGFGLVFIDQFSDDQKDTIEIFIPNPKEDVVKKNEQPAPTRKFLDIGSEEKSVAQVSPVSNKSCSAVATDKDFFNLRKKMAALETEEAMINESRKGFKSKCYTTEQIKNLGSLFLKESGKFQFYEAAYPFSSDQRSFVALQSDFKDNYFIYRFKKLVN